MNVDPLDKSLLEEIRANFDYYLREWAEVRDEGKKDMKYLAGDPWDAKERDARTKADRPCLSLDELTQYVNELVNTVRENRRAIKVVPRGDGANDKTANWRGGMLREIEYKSNAQSAYVTGFEGAVQRSYGGWRVRRAYEPGKTFKQILKLERIPNPDSLLFDPDARERDFTDGGGAFVIDGMSTDSFRRRWPNAKITSFSTEQITASPSWLQDKRVQVAEYWKVKSKARMLVELDTALNVTGNPETTFYLDELKGAKLIHQADRFWAQLSDGRVLRVIQKRKDEDKAICQYITNGVEILEEHDWPGRYIPLIPCVGKEMWYDRGDGARRMYFSLVRLAREPYMLYCYARTSEAELAGQIPKNPYMGYEGQFATSTDWKNINKLPNAYAEAKAWTEHAGSAENPLPLPRREEWNPAIQSLEMLAESARRAIQSAMGISALPTAAQRSNEKSGVALERIQKQTARGSFHFIDNFDGSIELTGRIMDNLLDEVYFEDGREVGIRNEAQEYSTLKLNIPYRTEKGEDVHFKVDEGEHDVTISTGPSYDSQREQVESVANALIQDPACPPKIKALAIKLMNMGPLGDQIADAFNPSEQQGPTPEQMEQALAQRDGLQKALDEALSELKSKAAEKQLDADTRVRIATLQAQAQIIIKMVDVDAAGAERLAKLDILKLEHMQEHTVIDHQAEVAPEPEPAPAA